jgi:hypothetical protein
LKPNCLDVTLCIPAWKESMGSGTSVIQGSVSVGDGMPGTTADWTRAAAVARRLHWMKKEEARVVWRRVLRALV